MNCAVFSGDLKPIRSLSEFKFLRFLYTVFYVCQFIGNIPTLIREGGLFMKRYRVAPLAAGLFLAASLVGLSLQGPAAYAVTRSAAVEYLEDINQDGNISIADVIALLLLARDNPDDPRVDYNGDGKWAIADAIALLLNIRDGNLTPLEQPSLSGGELLEERCTACHTLDRVETARAVKDRSAWETTLNGMIVKGAELSDDESGVLLDYLYGGSLLQQRCTRCHSLDQVYAAVTVKDSAAWDVTVTRMIGKGAQLDQSEKGSLIGHLVVLGQESEN